MAYRAILPILLLLSATLCLARTEDTTQAGGNTVASELQPAAPAPQETAGPAATPPPEDSAQVDGGITSAKPLPPVAAKEAELAPAENSAEDTAQADGMTKATATGAEETEEPAQPPPAAESASVSAEPAAEVSAPEHPSAAATEAQPAAVAPGKVVVSAETVADAPAEDMVQDPATSPPVVDSTASEPAAVAEAEASITVEAKAPAAAQPSKPAATGTVTPAPASVNAPEATVEVQAGGKTTEPSPTPPSAATPQPPKVPPSPPGKLLVVPMDGSHWVGIKAVAQEMGRRGHKVTVVIPEVSMRLGPGEHYQTLTYPVPYTREHVEELHMHHSQQLESMNTTVPLLERIDEQWTRKKEVHNFLAVTCESLLFNEELVAFLREQKFDAVLTDPMVPTGAILAQNLSVTPVYMLRGIPCGLDLVGAACPSPPSYVPRFFSGGSDKMGFMTRVVNFMVALLEPVLCKVVYSRFDGVASRFLHTDTTVAEIFTSAPVWLLRYDFTMEHPRPLMPNMVLIGGINCGVRKPLTQELQEFVEGSGEHGIVVFTLGSMVASMPKEKAHIFFSAFARIPQRVLWRYSGPLPDHVPDNIKVMNWLPQNDLLGHPKAKAFITHGGTHGIYEGICNGVPMVMLPLFGDQNDNVLRVASRGVGVVLSIFDVTSDALVEALDKVINDSSYQEKMKKLSAIHNDRPMEPLDLAVYWTEFVMRHKGAAHLRPAAHDLNWVQYHSLDVLGFLFIVIATVVLVTIKCCSFCIRKCCGGRLQKPKKD